jgi:uncharacterized protein YqeY
MTKEQLQEELKKSMLAKDADRTSVLRMLISAIGYYEIQKGGAGYQATQEDVMNVLTTEVKKRKDAIEQFMTAGREDLVAKESKEAAILEVFLPEQMSKDEVKRAVAEAIEKTGATSPSDMGKVMGVLMPVVKGKADGSMVSRIVKESLNS